MALLNLENLCIGYRTAKGMLKAVDGVNITLEEGRSLGLVGESGCGKTTIGMALMGLLPPNGEITGGRIVLDGLEISALNEDELREVRWNQVAMIFQAAMNALNPVIRISAQMSEAIKTHRPDMDDKAVLERVEGLFNLVGLSLDRLHDFPHQYSGGMKQRAIIAMALALNPKLIIADEPTTALDVIVQDQILKETKALQEQFDIGIIFISHDISIVAEVCHDIGVMYAGQLVESGPAQEVFFNSKHPYTKALVGSFPTLAGPKSKLTPIPGEPPNLVGTIPGCRFCDRCPKDTASCKLTPPKWQQVSERHWVLCDHC